MATQRFIIIDREELLTELQRVLGAQTAEVLMGVLERVASQVYAAGVTAEAFAELHAVVERLTHITAELAEAQRRAEERLDRLEAAVERLEAAVERLAEAQRRAEERLDRLEAAVERLEAAVERLAEAQRRTEERVDRLEAAVERLEAAVERLAEAQRRTEERLDRLEAAVERLAEAQRRTEERLDRLEAAVERLAEAQRQTMEAVDRLRQQVGGLSDRLGGDLEDIAYIVVHDVLEREFGWEVGVLERSWVEWDDRPEEVNLLGTATDPARPGVTIWIVGEAKYNLTVREANRFARQVNRARRHLVGEVFPVCFCYRARPEVRERVRDLGLHLVFSYGRLVLADRTH